MDVDESFLEISEMNEIELNEEIAKIQAMMRGALVRKQMAEIRDLYEQIVQSIDCDRKEVEWPAGILSRPVVRNRSHSHQTLPQSEVNNVEEQSIAISEHKSVASVCKNRQKSKRKSHSVVNHSCTQAKARGGRSQSRERNFDNNQTDKLVECFEDSDTVKRDVRDCETQIWESARRFDKKSHSVNDHAGSSEQRCELHVPDNFHDETASRDVELPRVSDTCMDINGAKAQEVKERDLRFVKALNTSEEVSEKQYTCAEVQTEDIENKLTGLNKGSEQENPDPKHRNSTSKEAESVGTVTDTKLGVHGLSGVVTLPDNEIKASNEVDENAKEPEKEGDETRRNVGASQANDCNADLPSDKQDLIDLRSTTIMELLWVQQAIVSRKNYLRMRQQVQ